MPFPVRLLSDYSRRPLAVVIYAVAFIAAMQLQRLIWLDVTGPEHRDLLREPVPVGMFAPRYATLVWAVILPLRLVAERFTSWRSWRSTGV
jgi:hypothetical protein